MAFAERTFILFGMAPILRTKMRWTGFAGSPGYSVFHFRDFDATPETTLGQTQAQAAVDKVAAFGTAIRTWLPNAARLDVQADVELLEDTTGELLDVFTTTAPASIAGGGSTTSGYSAASGAVITWRTAGIRRGRRVRGRTFLVPLTGTAYQTDGTIQDSVLTSIRDAAGVLANNAGSPDLGIWSRPSAPGATDGAWFAVRSYTVPDMAAVLKSRRS